jgi:hypothetical protein
MIGPFSTFYTFPSTQVNIDFNNFPNANSPPIATTSNGTSVTISFSYQYILIKEKIPDLFALAKQDYEKTFI